MVLLKWERMPPFYYKTHINPIKFKEKEEQERATYGVDPYHWEYLCREYWPSARFQRYFLANKSNREANNINHHFGSKPAREDANEWGAKYRTEPIEFELWKIGHEKSIYTEGPTKDLYEWLLHNYKTEISQGSDPVVSSKRLFIAANKLTESRGRTRLGGPGLQAPKLLKLGDKLTQSQEKEYTLEGRGEPVEGRGGSIGRAYVSNRKED